VNLTVGEDESIPVISYLEGGKSTLLKIVTDLEEVTFGSVRLNGKEIDKPASLGSNGVSPILFIMMKS
jgi:ABC-type nitrate/sulfonate/bicarbonate transport system ATPase subunit